MIGSKKVIKDKLMYWSRERSVIKKIFDENSDFSQTKLNFGGQQDVF